MKSTISIAVFASVLGACAVVCVIALYSAGALAAAQTVRSAPFIGPIASARIQAWVMGAVEPDTIDDLRLVGTPAPIHDSGYYTVTPPAGDWGPDDCMLPRGAPVAGPVISGFEPPDRPTHTGIDISVVSGTPVQATQCGIVAFAGWSDIGYGNLVVIQYDAYSTYYAHNETLYVAAGAKVNVGQVIAASGSTGNSTGPHVHYETRINGASVDPLSQFP